MCLSWKLALVLKPLVCLSLLHFTLHLSILTWCKLYLVVCLCYTRHMLMIWQNMLYFSLLLRYTYYCKKTGYAWYDFGASRSHTLVTPLRFFLPPQCCSGIMLRFWWWYDVNDMFKYDVPIPDATKKLLL